VFSEGTAKLLKNKKAKLKMKVLAPSSTKTEFVERSIIKSKVNPKLLKESEIKRKDYQKEPELVAKYIYELYKSDKNIGIVDATKNILYLKDQYFNDL
jgi:short-subunit dehydrogenase